MNNDFNYISDLEKFTNNVDIGLNNKEYPSSVEAINYQNKNIFLKRDDKLTLGCSKQRSLIFMVFKYLSQGKHKYTVSSSGNAALVCTYLAQHKFFETSLTKIEDLRVLLSNDISDAKLQKFVDIIEDDVNIKDLRNGYKNNNLSIELCENPKQKAFQLDKEGFVNLRGSTDDLALVGFKTIANELVAQVSNIDAVFVPASSGSTAVGIYKGFEEVGLKPQMHIVQTTKVNTLVKKILHENIKVENIHPAESIVDMIGHRRRQIEEIILNTNGKGWIISAEETENAHNELKERYNIETSYDSALTFAAYKKAVLERTFKNPVLIFTGS